LTTKTKRLLHTTSTNSEWQILFQTARRTNLQVDSGVLRWSLWPRSDPLERAWVELSRLS
jgi:hypothetical protein